MIIGMKIKNIISKLSKSQIYLLGLLLVLTVIGVGIYIYNHPQLLSNRLLQEHIASLQVVKNEDGSQFYIHKKNYSNDFLQKKYISFNQDGFRPSQFLYIDYTQDLKLGILGNWWTEGFAFSDAETMPFMFGQMSVATKRIGMLVVKGSAEAEIVAAQKKDLLVNNKQHTLEIKNFSVAGNSWLQQLELATTVLNTNSLSTMLLILNANEILKDFQYPLSLNEQSKNDTGFALPASFDWAKQNFCVAHQEFENSSTSKNLGTVVDQLENSLNRLLLKTKLSGTRVVILYVPTLTCDVDNWTKDFDQAVLRRFNAFGLSVCEASLSENLRKLVLQEGMQAITKRALNDFMVVNAYHCISRSGI